MKTLLNNGSQAAHVSAEPTPVPPDEALTHVSEARSTATADPLPKHEAPATPTNGSTRITQAELARSRAACAALSEMVASGRDRGRAGTRRILLGPLGEYGAQHGEHGRRLH